MEGTLYLENGQAFQGKGFGAAATKVGELVFTTAMSGYQETLTDPGSKGQIINMTYPLIGNYGISDIDNQSDGIHAEGLVARDISFRPSNRRSVMGIAEWLKEHGVPGVYNVDTRAIMKLIWAEGIMKCTISTDGISKDHAMDLMENASLRGDYMKDAGVQLRTLRPGSAAEGAPGRGLKIVAFDFGIKNGIVNAITRLGCDLVLCPYGTSAEEVLAMNPDGLLLSNGPGDPNECVEGIKTIAALINSLPIFGIGLGHELLALAAGGKTYKLKFGHRGANHGVLNLDTGKSVITSQGHGFAVDADSLKDTGMLPCYINLNDGTVEGIRHETLPVFSVQFHPEGVAGPRDSVEVFNRFIDMILASKAGTWKGGGLHA